MKSFYRIRTLAIVLGISAVWGLQLYPASCPEPEVMKDFDIERVRLTFLLFPYCDTKRL